ncbi:flagellar biosynthesis protein [Alkalibacterium sp. f15]|uniref:flagellar biosynthesis protein n=1 Tax=Alkalibacterium sp. f15 TaxID=3414029 RepID=UPI003BF8FBF6
MLQNIHGVPPQVSQVKTKETKQATIDRTFKSFMQEALIVPEKKTTTVTFSNHAQKRLDQHGFTLSYTDMQRLEEAVETLEAKGSENSLILYDDLALIASIKNKTVITALKSTEMSEVTNIDSAIQINQKR